MRVGIISLLVVCTLFATSFAVLEPAEKQVLEVLYATAGGNYWTNNSGWIDDTTDPCEDSWFGVTCDTSNVKLLELGANNLIGYVPDLSGLTSLTKL